MTDPAVPGITRHFVTIGERQMHYRRGGKGPALVLLHRLPRSSKDLVPAMRAMMGQFTVIAPDLAGYGNSWLLHQTAPRIDDYAADVSAFLDAIGVKRCLLYGEAEGGAVALVLAAQHPQKVAALAVQGLRVADSGDVAISDVLIPFTPTWDGRHLAWLWAMLREENAFAPPWIHRLATRVHEPMPSPAELHARAVQFITGEGQGRNYHLGLDAALDFNPAPHVAKLTVPAMFTGARSRNDHASLERLRYVKSDIVDDFTAARAKAFAFLVSQASPIPSPPLPPAVKPVHGNLWSDFVAVPGGQMHFHMNGDAITVPVLIQHDAASAVGIVERITETFIGRRTVMAFDMPGSGESDKIIGDTVEVSAYAEVLNAALDNLGLKQIDFYGMWGGGFVGLELAFLPSARVRRLVMSNVFQHDGEEQRAMQFGYTPDVSPHWHGGHLMQCWHQMRDQGIWYPWFDTARVIPREPHLATEMIHGRVCALMKAGNMYRTAYQSHFRYRTYERLKESPVQTTIGSTSWDPNYAHTEAAARAAPNAAFRVLDPDLAKWGLGFIDVLEAAD